MPLCCIRHFGYIDCAFWTEHIQWVQVVVLAAMADSKISFSDQLGRLTKCRLVPIFG